MTQLGNSLRQMWIFISWMSWLCDQAGRGAQFAYTINSAWIWKRTGLSNLAMNGRTMTPNHAWLSTPWRRMWLWFGVDPACHFWAANPNSGRQYCLPPPGVERAPLKLQQVWVAQAVEGDGGLADLGIAQHIKQRGELCTYVEWLLTNCPKYRLRLSFWACSFPSKLILAHFGA